MNVSRNDISKSEVELTITGSESKISEIKTHTLEKMQRDVSAPGFRKGKAPLNVVEKNVKEDLLQSNVLEELVNHLYSDAVAHEKLRPVANPKINVTKFVPYDQFEMVASVSVIPPISLSDYKNIKKKKPEVNIEEKDIDEVVENLKLRGATKQTVEREAKDGDEVLIDFSGKTPEGKDVKGASGKDYPLRLGSDAFIPGFEEKLVGVKQAEKKEFTLTFPKDYAHKPLAGSDVVFSVDVKAVNELKLAAIDDEFAKKVGPFESVEDLRKDIKTQLTAQKNQEATEKLKDEIVGEIAEKSSVEAPESLIDDQAQVLLEDFVKNLTYRGLTLDEYLDQQGVSKEDHLNNEMKPKAEARVKAGIVIAEIAEAEGISVSPEELDIRIQLLKGQNQSNADQFDSPEARRDVGSRLITEKTVDKLVEYATGG